MEAKLCKKCGVEIFEGENKKIKLCETCNEKRKSTIKKILIGAGTVTATAVAAILAGIASKNKQEIHDIFDDYEDYGEDDCNDSESLSVWDAADIYLSSGFDEDYSFGYSHEELTDALK